MILNKLRLILILSVVTAVAACSGSRQGGNGEPGKAGGDSGAKSASIAAKVLLHQRHSGVVAADGLLFIMNYELAMLKDDVKKGATLTSDDGITVESESRSEFKSPVDKKPLSTPADWKKDPKNFDFLIDWNIDWLEHSKKSMDQGVAFTVKETWQLDKVSDPRTTRTWSYTFELRGPAILASTTEKDEEAVTEQIKTVVRPLREPVLKEIRTFIEANK